MQVEKCFACYASRPLRTSDSTQNTFSVYNLTKNQTATAFLHVMQTRRYSGGDLQYFLTHGTILVVCVSRLNLSRLETMHLRNGGLFQAIVDLAMTADSLMAPALFGKTDQLEAIKHIPIFIAQGDADEVVSVELARRWVARMGELEMVHSYVEIPGGDHNETISENAPLISEIFDFFDRYSQ